MCIRDRCIGEWSDLDDVQARVYITEEYQMQPKKGVVMDAVLSVAHQNAFHPVREWLRSLVWDGETRLDSLAGKYLGGISTAGSASLETTEPVSYTHLSPREVFAATGGADFTLSLIHI